ncbi:helix-turn-helix domain-containing protein [Endozoicomonas sp.]|uniref:helix-turn-helix domain-containing protein n=1 Tax=Endozoicomonas sp. TaxID=1892382 RepID=UPI00383A35B2
MQEIRINIHSSLTPAQRLMLVMLSSYANEDGYCWPSQATLARDVGITRQNANIQLKFLESLGYITSQQRINQDKGKGSKIYRMNLDPIQSKSPKVVAFEQRKHQTTHEKLTDVSWADDPQVQYIFGEQS